VPREVGARRYTGEAIMAAMEIVRSVVVDRHIEDVFDYIADRGHDRAWWREVVTVEQLIGEAPGPGALYGVTLRRGRRVTATCVAFEPPGRLAWREEDSSGDTAHVAYELASVWTATRVTRTEASGATGSLSRLRRARAAARALSALTRVLERR
jgi:uncharacterized protein YndB with AHSA1/START domain